MTSELVMLSLDLVKTRLSVMIMEMRKNFIQVILTSLIEKSPDPKILRAVVKIVEEWVKNNSPMAANQVGGRFSLFWFFIFQRRKLDLIPSASFSVSVVLYALCVMYHHSVPLDRHGGH